MPNYIQDPNNSKKQIPGPKPDNAYDRVGTVTSCTLVKQPNSVLVTSPLTSAVGFFFGSSASFAELGTAGKILRTNYVSMLSGSLTGTKLDIHPCAVSGSVNDIQRIMFIYKGGPDGSGRP